MLDENDLQKLLRAKRHEQPPPEYFQDFLAEFQRRQREELLRRPLRQLIADRVSTFFQQFALPNYAYAAASVLVLVAAGITTENILKSPGGPAPMLADQSRGPALQIATVASARPESSILQLSSRSEFPNLRLAPADLRQTSVINADSSPYYTLDARPVSYERSVRF